MNAAVCPLCLAVGVSKIYCEESEREVADEPGQQPDDSSYRACDCDSMRNNELRSSHTMTTNHEHLRKVAEKATPQDFDSAEIVAKEGWIECPCCSGEGSVELTADYCNYDNEALGVQFYGVGPAYVNAEEFYRTLNPTTAIALLDELAALRKENDGLRAVVMDILKLADEHRAGGCRIFQVMTDCPLTEAARAAIGDSHE